MEFTKRGLIKKNKNSYCKSWEDVFQVLNRDTIDKRKKCKSKYKEKIKQISFVSSNKKYTYMVACKELAGNKIESDLQKLANGNTVEKVKTNRAISKWRNHSALIKIVLSTLAESIEYQWNGNYVLFEGDVINLTDGTIVMNFDYIRTSIIEFSKNHDDNLIDNIVWSILLDLKFKIDRIVIKVFHSKTGETIKIPTRLNGTTPNPRGLIK